MILLTSGVVACEPELIDKKLHVKDMTSNRMQNIITVMSNYSIVPSKQDANKTFQETNCQTGMSYQLLILSCFYNHCHHSKTTEQKEWAL